MPATEPSTIEQIRQDLRDIRIFCGRYFPFVVIPLSYVPIVSVRNVLTAGVNKEGVIAINPSWWANLSVETKRYVIIHECLHLALLHPFRSQGFNHEAYNIAADGKVNHAIDSANICGIECENGKITLGALATVTGMRLDDLYKMSTEEIASLLEKKQQGRLVQAQGGQNGASTTDNDAPQQENQQIQPNPLINCPTDLQGDLLTHPIEGERIQSPSISASGCRSNTPLSQDALRDVWKTLCEKAVIFARQAGNVPAGLERLVDEVLEVKPPWNIALRFGLGNGKVDSSYSRPSRRGDDYPGQYKNNYTTWCLIDTSGSIGEEELNKFLGIIKHEAKNARVLCVPWDAQAYDIIKVEKPNDVAKKVARKMKGGGGTVCQPVLEKVFSRLQAGDAVIMLTDGEIFDIDKDETKQWLRRISSRAGFAMIGYTAKPITAPGFLTANIRLGTQ